MDVSRLLVSYPPLATGSFALEDAPTRNLGLAKDLFHMEEFYRERYLRTQDASSLPGNLLKHQKVLARFLASATPYDRLLVVHEVGTGKTCGAVAIAEANRGNKKEVVFVSPNKHLNKQQRNQLSVCFPGRLWARER